GSASLMPLTRWNAAIINTKFTNRLAQSAMNKKMLRQPSLRSDAIPERNCRRTAAHTSGFVAELNRLTVKALKRRRRQERPRVAHPVERPRNSVGSRHWAA